jgi:hypothetical protein
VGGSNGDQRTFKSPPKDAVSIVSIASPHRRRVTPGRTQPVAGSPSPPLHGGSDATGRFEHVSVGRRLQQAGARSPISPTSASPAAASQTAAMKAAASLPFKGDISGTTRGVFTPPATLEIHLSGEGNATHLGRFTSEEHTVGTFPNPVATGTWAFRAANGDRLFATTESTGTPVAPGIDDVKTVATITGGTGRFADASGTFTAVIRASHDPISGKGEFSGSFSGDLSLKH